MTARSWHYTRVALLVTCLAGLGGCAHFPYTPRDNVRFDPIPEFSSKHAVTLVNAQSETAEYPLVRKSFGRYYANRREWTDVALRIAARELAARGMTMADRAQHTLRLSVESCTTEVGMVLVETQISLKVEAGDGYRTTVIGRNSSAVVSNYERQVDGAMMRAVAAMLSDPKIVAYLTR